jgi:EAL domain-containing protein (putative c-di-GMP-specific phosphodiesterase class I)/ActR/RegA family two-component response regulator
MQGAQPRARVLVVDDEPGLRDIYGSVLREAGYAVDLAPDLRTARALLAENGFDLVISDISLPDGTGIDVLKTVRERSLDLPVILVTGAPALDTAIHAIELGAMRYFVKPLRSEDLLHVAEQATRLHRLAQIKREALAYLGATGKLVPDTAGLEAVFARGLRSLWMAFQPIVRAIDGQLFGYEALLRTEEASFPAPGAFLEAAERLGRTSELGRSVRAAVAHTRFTGVAPAVFVNLHPRDLDDDALYDPASPLSAQASRVVLEITERESLDGAANVRDRIASLRQLGYRIAVDDLGAGYAGLSTFALLEPDIAKIDISLVRGVDREPMKRRLITSLTTLCKEMGVLVVAEGIETAGERAALTDVGCDLLQGFLLGRPQRPV